MIEDDHTEARSEPFRLKNARHYPHGSLPAEPLQQRQVLIFQA